MAKIVQAVSSYGPKVELNSTTQLDQVADWMAMRTGLNKSEVMMVVKEHGPLGFTDRNPPI